VARESRHDIPAEAIRRGDESFPVADRFGARGWIARGANHTDATRQVAAGDRSGIKHPQNRVRHPVKIGVADTLAVTDRKGLESVRKQLPDRLCSAVVRGSERADADIVIGIPGISGG